MIFLWENRGQNSYFLGTIDFLNLNSQILGYKISVSSGKVIIFGKSQFHKVFFMRKHLKGHFFEKTIFYLMAEERACVYKNSELWKFTIFAKNVNFRNYFRQKRPNGGFFGVHELNKISKLGHFTTYKMIFGLEHTKIQIFTSRRRFSDFQNR